MRSSISFSVFIMIHFSFVILDSLNIEYGHEQKADRKNLRMVISLILSPILNNNNSILLLLIVCVSLLWEMKKKYIFLIHHRYSISNTPKTKTTTKYTSSDIFRFIWKVFLKFFLSLCLSLCYSLFLFLSLSLYHT